MVDGLRKKLEEFVKMRLKEGGLYGYKEVIVKV